MIRCRHHWRRRSLFLLEAICGFYLPEDFRSFLRCLLDYLLAARLPPQRALYGLAPFMVGVLPAIRRPAGGQEGFSVIIPAQPMRRGQSLPGEGPSIAPPSPSLPPPTLN